MAVLDNKSVFLKPTASGGSNQSVTIQPAAGEVWLVTNLSANIAGGGNNRTDVYITDGSNELAVVSYGLNTAARFNLYQINTIPAGAWTGKPLIIDNSTYLIIKFTADGAGDYEYFVNAIQIK